MSENILIAILTLVGTLVGTFGGILTGSKLLLWRVEQLEIKMDKHNKVIERTFRMEGEITELQHDVRDIKNKI